jgi:hypothetical protein
LLNTGHTRIDSYNSDAARRHPMRNCAIAAADFKYRSWAMRVENARQFR